MGCPRNRLKQWIAEEHRLGAPNPQHAVLSTVSADSNPHARVVAIREIDAQGLLFFTQKGTRKVTELLANPMASLTFWFELQQAEVIIEGSVTPLSDADNQLFWASYPLAAQIRFTSYAPTSSQPISSLNDLEKKRISIALEHKDKPLPLSPWYCGFRLQPQRMVFYTYRSDSLSDVVEYVRTEEGGWHEQLLSP